MPIPRIYHNEQLAILSEVTLFENSSYHIIKVLRLKTDDVFTIFNGDGNEYKAKITKINKDIATATILELIRQESITSPLVHLHQSVLRSEKMEYTIQKSTELGVNTITPIFTERCNISLDKDRLSKRITRWQTIANNASEQSSRTTVPKIMEPQNLYQLLRSKSCDLLLILHPDAKISLAGFLKNLSNIPKSVSLLIGPEGGLSDLEIDLIKKHNTTFVNLGPRILRTETAALVAISIIQSIVGDLK